MRRAAFASRVVATLILASSALLPVTGAPAGGRRIALVVGNGHYTNAALRNAPADARDMAQALRELGYEVEFHQDADWNTLLRALGDFTLRARESDVRLFYYAGHGMQVNGHNYLNPIGTVPASESELRAHAIDMDELVEHLGAEPTGLSVVIVDACRDNPFAGMLHATRGASPRGLAPTPAPRGMVVAFSTGPNASARDGDDGHSPYTRHLLEALQVPGLQVEQVFKRVHDAVEQDTQGAQHSWLSTSLSGEFCFRPSADGHCRSN